MRDFSTIRSLTAILFSSAPRISTTAVLTNFGGIATGMRRTSRRFSVACTVFVCQTAIQRRATPPFKQYFIHSVLSGHNGRITAIARATFHPRSSSEATATSPTDPTNERRISPPFSRVRWYFSSTWRFTRSTFHVFTHPFTISFTRTIGTPPSSCFPGCTIPYETPRGSTNSPILE
ncbi:hypothetical protein SMALA_4875 [Streptomyces malaysiensis subsp. malaysiensis]|nr:hypothetical protein SMALA_4875 [Streptomyces malaysiensis]